MSAHHAKPLVVQFTSTNIDKQSGIAKGSGKPYELFKQTAYIYIGDAPFPEKIEVLLDDGQPAFAIGKYSLDVNRAIVVGAFHSLAIDSRKLVFVPIETKAS